MIIIALGANLPSCVGEPAETLSAALTELMIHGISLLSVSSLYQTPAWPDPTEPPFLNAVASVKTDMLPRALLQLLHQVEAKLGRVRSRPNAPRTLDLDLLAYNTVSIADEGLRLPHPRIAERSFVLVPLSEIAPQWVLPGTGQIAAELLASRPGAERAAILRQPDYGYFPSDHSGHSVNEL